MRKIAAPDQLVGCRVHQRLRERLDDVASIVNGSTSASALAQEVFPRVLYDNPRQAFGESLAHLNMLASMGRLARDVSATGAVTFAPV